MTEERMEAGEVKRLRELLLGVAMKGLPFPWGRVSVEPGDVRVGCIVPLIRFTDSLESRFGLVESVSRSGDTLALAGSVFSAKQRYVEPVGFKFDCVRGDPLEIFESWNGHAFTGSEDSIGLVKFIQDKQRRTANPLETAARTIVRDIQADEIGEDEVLAILIRDYHVPVKEACVLVVSSLLAEGFERSDEGVGRWVKCAP